MNIYGHYLIQAARSQGIRIVNLEDTTAPFTQAQLSVNDRAYDFTWIGDSIWVADYVENIQPDSITSVCYALNHDRKPDAKTIQVESLELETTADGSATLIHRATGITYRSVYGAASEICPCFCRRNSSLRP